MARVRTEHPNRVHARQTYVSPRRALARRASRCPPPQCSQNHNTLRAYSPTPRTCRSPPPLRTHQLHRLVALACGRRPVSEGGFTGVRLDPRRGPRRADPHLSAQTLFRRPTLVSKLSYPLVSMLISPSFSSLPTTDRASARKSTRSSLTGSGCAPRRFACSLEEARGAGLAGDRARAASAPGWAGSAPGRLARQNRTSFESARRSKPWCRFGQARWRWMDRQLLRKELKPSRFQTQSLKEKKLQKSWTTTRSA